MQLKIKTHLTLVLGAYFFSQVGSFSFVWWVIDQKYQLRHDMHFSLIAAYLLTLHLLTTSCGADILPHLGWAN